MATRKVPKTRLRLIQAPELNPGDAIWVYLRHSPGEDQTILSQRMDVERFVRERELHVAHWYTDEAKSGGTVENRDAFELMLADSQVQPPPVQAIVVWDLSRFSRDELEAQFYSADLRMRGYDILSIKDDIPQGEFSGIFEAFIRWKNSRYLRDLQAATIRGLDAVVRDKVIIDGVERTGFSAGGYPPVGYEARKVQIGTKPSGKPIERTYWVKNPDLGLQARVERAWAIAIDAATNGLPISCAQIHKECNLFRANTSYYSMFRTITYCGIRKVGERQVEGAHEAYITKEDFDLVQPALPAGAAVPLKIHPRRVASPMALSGRCYCGYCGSPLNYDVYHQRLAYTAVRCSGRKNDSHSCTLSRVNYAVFMEAIVEALQTEVLTEKTVRDLVSEMDRQLAESTKHMVGEKAALEKEITTLDKAIEKLLDALESTEAPGPIQARLVQRQRARDDAQSKLSELVGNTPRSKTVSFEKVWRAVQDMHAVLDQGDPLEIKELLEKIVLRVELTNENGRLFFRLPFGPGFRAMNSTPWGNLDKAREIDLQGSVEFRPKGKRTK